MNKFVEDLRQRKLQIDFTELKLVQSKATNPVSYTGAGYIRQTDDDLLSFKLYSVHFANTNCVPDLKRLGRFVSGTLYDDEDYYTLTGTAVDGTTWVAEKVLPHADWPLSRTNPVLQGRIAHCVRGERSPTSRDLQMYYFEKADIPCWLNQVKFDAGGCEFHIETTEVGFSVTAKSDATIPKHFHVRVEESLRSLLARSISCRALMEHGPLQLFSSNQRSHRTLLPPPIARSGPAWHDDLWRLFKCYLDYVVRGTTQAYWNTCTNHLHNACEASANSLEPGHRPQRRRGGRCQSPAERTRSCG